MGNWSEQQEVKKEVKEKDKVRRERLAGYFFNLSQLTYTALVLGSIVLFFQGNNIAIVLVVIIGMLIGIFFSENRK